MNPELVQNIADELQQTELNENLIRNLRATYPQLHFTYCLDDDINYPHPVLTYTKFNVYLVGGENCLALTHDYTNATGVVIAEITTE